MAVNKSEIKRDRKIPSVYYAVSKDFAYGMFNSCKDVQNPSTGKKALDMLCGREASECTPENWLQFMGDKTRNPMAPFFFYYTISNNATVRLDKLNITLKPMRDSVTPCNTSCSCQDCRTSCKPLPPDIPPEPWMILGIDPAYLIVGAVYLLFVLVFGAAHIWAYFYCAEVTKGWPLNDGITVEEEVVLTGSATPGCCDKFQVFAEEFLERCFYAWGNFCARHSLIVPLISIFICIILSVGLCFFQVTSDPVELWSAPDSQARKEKNYFDKNFRLAFIILALIDDT